MSWWNTERGMKSQLTTLWAKTRTSRAQRWPWWLALEAWLLVLRLLAKIWRWWTIPTRNCSPARATSGKQTIPTISTMEVKWCPAVETSLTCHAPSSRKKMKMNTWTEATSVRAETEPPTELRPQPAGTSLQWTSPWTTSIWTKLTKFKIKTKSIRSR